MRNVRLHLDDGVVLNVKHLRGEMLSTHPGAPPVFDDVRSYTIRLSGADVSIDAPSLANLMNRHVFAYDGAPLKDVDVKIAGGQLALHGKMHKGVWLPFSMKATASSTADGKLRLHAESIKALGVPATKLLELFGLTLEDLTKIERDRGVEIKDDDLIITAGRALPPPEIQGRLTRVEIRDGVMRQVFGDGGIGAPLGTPNPKAPNYVYFSGSVIRFGRLTMTDADLQLVDTDPKDAFDFSPAKYSDQLVAGYTKNQPNGGVKTYMPDFDDLPRR